MPHGRQPRLFLADGTGSGPRFYEIVNRTIQALGIPAVRIKEANSPDWPEFQRPGVYRVFAQDYAFNAPSPAACMVSGGSTAGTTAWKTEGGTTLGAYLESLTQ